MSSSFAVRHTLPIAMLVLVGLSGCNPTTQELVVMPDGSGKMIVTLFPEEEKDSFAPEEEQFLRGFFDQLYIFQKTPASLKAEGLVACSSLEAVKVGDKSGLLMNAYYENFNNRRGEGEPEDPPPEGPTKQKPCSFKKLEDGFVLEEFVPKDSSSIEFRYTLPGEIKSAEGAKTFKGRTATFDPPAEDTVFRIVCGPSQLSADEVAKFKKELDKAKADWNKRLTDMAEKMLGEAKEVIKDKPDEVREGLNWIVESLPKSKAAEEAKALLEQLDKQTPTDQ